MENSEKKSQIPPYFSWKTFSGYIKSLHQSLPSRIDRSAMRNLNGSNQNIMMNALIYLKLIQSDGTPEKVLEEIVEASIPEKQSLYQEHLRMMLQGAYPFLFDGSNSFNLERSTSAQFDEKFRATGASGETVKKCEAFFIAAAQEAGMKLSPHILDAKKRGPRKNLSTKVRAPKNDHNQEVVTDFSHSFPSSSNGDEPNFILPKWYENFKAVFEKLPDADKDPHWSEAERKKWIAALSALLDLYIRIDDGGNA